VVKEGGGEEEGNLERRVGEGEGCLNHSCPSYWGKREQIWGKTEEIRGGTHANFAEKKPKSLLPPKTRRKESNPAVWGGNTLTTFFEPAGKAKLVRISKKNQNPSSLKKGGESRVLTNLGKERKG